jgi:amino acid adenylation domain-containing protein/thioester reductase-like protein
MKGPGGETGDSGVAAGPRRQERFQSRFTDSERTDTGFTTGGRIISSDLSFAQRDGYATVVIRLIGNLDRNVLCAALERVVSRHRILRATSAGNRDTVSQVDNLLDGVFFVDQKVFDDADIERIGREEALRALGPGRRAIRARLVYQTEQKSALLITLHESSSDDWSARVLIDELRELYSAFVVGQDDPLPAPKFQYADYLALHRQLLEPEVLRTQLEFWKNSLSGAPELLELPTDYTRSARPHHPASQLPIGVSESLTKRLRGLALFHGVSLFTTLLSGFVLVLGRWSVKADVVIGTIVTNRDSAPFESLIGPLANKLALRVRLQSDATVKELLQQVQTTITDANVHRQVPFTQVVRALSPVQIPGQHPIFQAQLQFDTGPAHAEQTRHMPGLTFSAISVAHARTEVDLSLLLRPDGERLVGALEYADDLFLKDTIERMFGNFIVVLEAFVADPTRSIGRIPLLTDAEQVQLLQQFNSTATPGPEGQLVHKLIEAQVDRTPDATAMSYADVYITYDELNFKANQLARDLQRWGVGPGHLVAICASRRPEMVVGLLAILKAGGAYLPLDPNYPPERLQYMLRDASPKVVLTEEGLRDVLPPTEAQVVTLESSSRVSRAWDTGSQMPCFAPMTSRNLIYVIYTSGSTGQPKGTAMAHQSMINLIEWHRRVFADGEGQKVLQFAALSFDVAFQEIFSTLCRGSTLVLLDEWVRRDPRALSEILSSRSVDTLFVPPLVLQSLAEHCISGDGVPQSLEHIITAGEQLRISPEISRFLTKLDGCRIHNHYGPTETHVVTALSLIGDPREWPTLPAIGRPISNSRVYILDSTRQLVPIGVTGELYVGGTGVSQGYLRQPELTAQRFVADPFSGDSIGRLYKTGDLGRWRPDGTIEYLGRNDHQVKIRGFRIELGEVESQILRSGRVREAAVVVREDHWGDKRLVAYVVPTSKSEDYAGASDPATKKLVKQWQSIYDHSYDSSRTTFSPNFSGWNSSYTGLPISKEEMGEWLQSTVARIRSLKPKRVLEIGCGVGLLVEQLGGECVRYCATDLSPVAIRDLREWLATQEHLKHVEVSQSEATDLSGVGDGAFDTIVINSVTQHFPDFKYLLLVLEKVLGRLSEGGRIFVGDVMNRDLLELFHTSVQFYKANADMPIERLQERIRRSIEGENQLVLSPEFFHLLPLHFRRINHVEVQLRRGRFENELNAYRYDVVLHVGDAYNEARPQIEIRYDGPESVKRVDAQLRSQRRGVLRLSGVPNRRLASAREICNALAEVGPRECVDRVRMALRDMSSPGEDPESLWSLGEQNGYLVTTTWNGDSHEGEYDVLFIDPSSEFQLAEAELWKLPSPEEEIPWEKYANDPMALTRREDLVSHLREVLASHLPNHMVPSTFVVLNALPLNPNGKLDRRALPAPELGVGSNREYEPPQGKIEQALAAIWQELLQIERVGREDNFFELGGHSLLVVRMLERLRRVGMAAEVGSVFRTPTLVALARSLEHDLGEGFLVPPNLISAGCETITPQMLPLVNLEQEQINRIQKAVPGGAANIQDIYPLTPLQEGLLFHHMLNHEGGDTYVVTTLLALPSRASLDAFTSALQGVIDRHDMLRTAMMWEGLPLPVQVVHRRATLPIERLALERGRDVMDQMRERMRPEQQKLDLRQAPLMRLQVAADVETDRWYAILQLHHLVGDRQSLEIVFSEVSAYLDGHALEDLSVPVPYRNHVAETLARARTDDGEAFFRSKLGDVTEPTAPFGLLDVRGTGGHIEEARKMLDPALGRRARAAASRLRVSVATLFHAAWGLVVSSTTGRDDVVFGTVLLGRLQSKAGAERILGLFINTLPLRLQLKGLTVRSLVTETQRELVDLFRCEQASLAVAQRCSGVPGAQPLFGALLNYRHGALRETQWIGAGSGIQVLASQGLTNYPVTLSVDDLGDAFVLVAQTDSRIDPRRMAGYLSTAMQSLVDALQESPETLALAVPVLPEEERMQLIEGFNTSPAPCPPEKLVHELFEQQVERTPHAIAVEYAAQCLTYTELNSRANQLARFLRNQGVGPDHIVALCVERNLDMVVGLLGILKAGGAYLPLDPNYPSARLAHMLEDAAPRLVLTQEELRSVLPGTKYDVIALDAKLKDIASHVGANVPVGSCDLSARNLVYVIYTSGSTGVPKGTAMPHSSVVNLLEWHRSTFRANEGKRVLQFAALSFDVAFQETFTTLCTGGTLVLVDEWIRRDPPALVEFLHGRSVQRLFVPPLVLQAVAECFTSSGALPGSLRDVVTAGEQLRITPEIVSLFKQLEACQLHNHYGPTETHVVTALTLTGSPSKWPLLPSIGRPIPNARIYILDGNQRPVPIEVVGEIYIGGVPLASSYLNRPELTAERFIHDPFSTGWQSRLYKTGDMGRWHSDGTIEYLGRNDHQLKIRGYRVELGEIEARLTAHPQVKEAAVIAREDTPGEKRLVGYVSLRDQSTSDVEQVREDLKAVLPDYMVPSLLVVLPNLPLTPNGKLDRGALLGSDLEGSVSRQYDPPRGEIEEAVAAIWRELLGLQRVGRQDNFFEVGGHSMLVVRALSKISHRFGVALRVTDLYKTPTIGQLATRIAKGMAQEDQVDLSQEAVLDEGIAARPGSPCSPPKAIMLTGSTGLVGRFLLVRLLEDTEAILYCLIRGQSERQAFARLRATLSGWSLWRNEYEQRIVAVPGDLRLLRLGLDDQAYEVILDNVDTVYHCATSMNHLETYAMAKPANVGGCRELLKLATQKRPMSINYISTLGIFAPTGSDTASVVREDSPIDHEKHLRSQGYSASKWVGEKIFMIAGERGIPCNIFRLGLVWPDSKQGRYDELQHYYRLFKSCLVSGLGIRNYQPDMPPIPVDYVARAIAFLATQHSSGHGIFHISSSDQMVGGVFERFNEILDTALELLPFSEWISEMKRLHREGLSLPVVPLIDVYDYEGSTRPAMARFDCTRTHRELEQAGIVAPTFDDALLRVALEGMFARDPDLPQARMRKVAEMRPGQLA